MRRGGGGKADLLAQTGGPSESLKKPTIPCLRRGHQLLRMPLHRQHPPRRIRRLDGFDDSIACGRRHAKAGRDLVDRLVMRRVHRDLRRAHDTGEQGSLINRYGVNALGSSGGLIVVRLGRALRTDILNEGTPERDIDQLRAATDRECRRAPVASGAGEGELAGIAGGVCFAGLLVRGLIEVLGIDVLAAGEEQRVDAVECRQGRSRGNRRENEWRHPRGDEGVGVRLVYAHARPAANDFRRRGNEDAWRVAARLRVS